jgi:hypothetical protein
MYIEFGSEKQKALSIKLDSAFCHLTNFIKGFRVDEGFK